MNEEQDDPNDDEPNAQPPKHDGDAVRFLIDWASNHTNDECWPVVGFIASRSSGITKPKPKRKRASGKGSAIKIAFLQFWDEGKVNPSIPELRERIRMCGRHFASDELLITALKKSPLLYRLHPDNTASLVNPPRPKMVVSG